MDYKMRYDTVRRKLRSRKGEYLKLTKLLKRIMEMKNAAQWDVPKEQSKEAYKKKWEIPEFWFRYKGDNYVCSLRLNLDGKRIETIVGATRDGEPVSIAHLKRISDEMYGLRGKSGLDLDKWKTTPISLDDEKEDE